MQKNYSSRGGFFSVRRSSSQPNVSKAAKRDHDSVAPASPEGVTLGTIRTLLKESLAPITADLVELKSSAKFTTDKLDEIGLLSQKVKQLETEILYRLLYLLFEIADDKRKSKKEVDLKWILIRVRKSKLGR